jgi:hypothetical protein
MTDDDDGQNANGHGRSTGGHWVSEGGRLRWVPARDLAGNEPENDEAARELDDLDEAAWASDAPPLPPGAPESARVRAALAWLRRMRDLEREIVGELGFIEREQLRQQDAAPQPRRMRGPQPPSPITLQMAEHGAAADWFDSAYEVLVEEAERNPGRALVEWYLWLGATTPLAAAPADDPLVQARQAGEANARLRAQRHAERLALPEMDDEG